MLHPLGQFVPAPSQLRVFLEFLQYLYTQVPPFAAGFDIENILIPVGNVLATHLRIVVAQYSQKAELL
jgi:hypothetical protein